MVSKKLLLWFWSIFFLLISTAFTYAQSKSVEIWIRAFLPNPANSGAGADYIRAVGNASSVRLRNADGSFANFCFATDHRGFSTDPGLTSRLETRFVLTLNADHSASVIPAAGQTSSGITKKLDCTTGAVLEQKQGTIDRDHIGTPAVADGTVQIIGQVQGRNPLTPLGSAGPSIDYSYDVQWTPGSSTLIISVTVGSFPAMEVYARQPTGDWITIIQQLPTGTPWSLGGDSFGINAFSINKTKTIPGLSGKWTSADQRFSFEFLGQKIKWNEKNAAGALLTKIVDVQELPDGKFRIERPNDNEVLTFLGFQPTVKTEILARGPKPSFMVIYRKGDKLFAEWNGLSVIKNTAAHVERLVQPGENPPKALELTALP